ncbi:MAG: hypothetical protein LBR64_01250 [Dysgonamonadaceae bacterium]|jgi:hypothetical protein|nr:hypothetical protein [Dysgonamonadaceae bacterium]
MKKFFLLVLILFPAIIYAQEISNVQKINVYGVDFSHAGLYALTNDNREIKSGLCRINALLEQEPKKYDFAKYLKKGISGFCTESTDEINEAMDAKAMKVVSPDYALTDDQINETLDNLNCEGNDGVGFVLIAELLNKTDEKASFVAVFFDEETKEVIYSKLVTGKTQGFGVRNHWAYCVYQVLKHWKY